MALNGIKVIEMVGLAPAPFCGQVLSDFGANVLRIDRAYKREIENLKRGKKLCLIDLKTSKGKEIFMRLCETADVLIECFRPGVMERLGLGPQVLIKSNQKLIYARLTGYGQTGYLSGKAGHDINYLAISGILSKLGPNERPHPPINILGDYAGGGLICAFGICLALIERTKSGKGQVIDSNLTEGVAYTSSWIWESLDDNYRAKPYLWPHPDQRMRNTFDGNSPFYRCYKTKDNKFMAVGAQEFKFYKQFVEVLGLNIDDCDRNDFDNWDKLNEKFEKVLNTKTQEEWMAIFDGVDACVTPVLDIESAHNYKHNIDRNSFFIDGKPRPAPILSRTPAIPTKSDNDPNDHLHTKKILLQLGYSEKQIHRFAEEKIVEIETYLSK